MILRVESTMDRFKYLDVLEEGMILSAWAMRGWIISLCTIMLHVIDHTLCRTG